MAKDIREEWSEPSQQTYTTPLLYELGAILEQTISAAYYHGKYSTGVVDGS